MRNEMKLLEPEDLKFSELYTYKTEYEEIVFMYLGHTRGAPGLLGVKKYIITTPHGNIEYYSDFEYIYALDED
jgi:hypothetical protein